MPEVDAFYISCYSAWMPIHVPVLLAQVIEWLSPAAGGIFVDGTLVLADTPWRWPSELLPAE